MNRTTIATMFCAWSVVVPAITHSAEEHPHQHGHQQHSAPQDAATPAPMHAGHGGEHGAHGMIVPESREFATLAYDDARTARAPQRMAPPPDAGHPHRGKQLAYDPNKGRCLSCHVLGADSEQPGTVGPNLSEYGKRHVDPAQTFQQIWDARVRHANSAMPPFGTHGLLTAQEIADIVAYLNRLDTPVESPAPLARESRGVWVAGEGLTRADGYIDEGEALFRAPGKNGKSCASCHGHDGAGPKLSGVAATFPKWDAQRNRFVVLEQRINRCRMQYMDSDHYPLGSQESNLLTSYVKYLSRRAPVQVAADGPVHDALERGKASFNRRAGQLNFSCANCHAAEQPIVGRWLRGDVTQAMTGDGTHRDMAAQWPKHFIGGHDLGLQSLQQRIQHCQIVTRTYPLELGSPEYVELEMYLTSLANGAPLLAPTMTRLRGE